MPIDALILAATDPDTLLGARRRRRPRHAARRVCQPFWEYEFEVPDFNKFADLARGPRHVADLHAATGGRPERSARWRELRDAAWTPTPSCARRSTPAAAAGGCCTLNRAGTARGFSDDEVAFVETIAPVVGRALRLSLVSHPGARPRRPRPRDGDRRRRQPPRVRHPRGARLVRRARVDLPRARPRPRRSTSRARSPSPPQEARARARGATRAARAHPRPDAQRRVAADPRLVPARRRRRRRDAAVVIEPAKASEVAPLIVEAYELTPREVDVTRALARGLTTNEIARELHLSRYTVQDHLKSVYEKAGVSSRGELVAKMFADHYHDGLADAVQRRAAPGREPRPEAQHQPQHRPARRRTAAPPGRSPPPAGRRPRPEAATNVSASPTQRTSTRRPSGDHAGDARRPVVSNTGRSAISTPPRATITRERSLVGRRATTARRRPRGAHAAATARSPSGRRTARMRFASGSARSRPPAVGTSSSRPSADHAKPARQRHRAREPFGALAYHFGTRRLSFIKTRKLLCPWCRRWASSRPAMRRAVSPGCRRVRAADVRARARRRSRERRDDRGGRVTAIAAPAPRLCPPLRVRAERSDLPHLGSSTYACNLACVHCLSSSGRRDRRELSHRRVPRSWSTSSSACRSST